MSEFSPPPIPACAAESDARPLSPEKIEIVLNYFRAWYQEFGAVRCEPPAPAASPPDLHTLLGQFIAQRHEVNLQTRAVRSQQEQNAETLRQLSAALEAVQHARRQVAETSAAALEEQLRPLLKSFVDVFDALSLAQRESERGQPAVGTTLEQLVELTEKVAETQRRETVEAPSGFWPRWLMAPAAPGTPAANAPSAELKDQAEVLAARVRKQLESLLTGYNMSVARIARTLVQLGLEPIPCVGEPFDPERMEVVEVVGDSGRPGGEVIDEVRPGYLWRDKVFRYAQVRVAKP